MFSWIRRVFGGGGGRAARIEQLPVRPLEALKRDLQKGEGAALEARYQGRHRKHQVAIAPAEGTPEGVEIRVASSRPLEPEIDLRAGTGVHGGLLTGDAAFDPRFQLRARSGDSAVGRLNADLRGLLVKLAEASITLHLDRDGLTLTVGGAHRSRAMALVDDMVTVLEHLSATSQPARDLAELVRRDPVVEVRMRALKLLLEHHRTDPACLRAAERAQMDPDWDIVMVAMEVAGSRKPLVYRVAKAEGRVPPRVIEHLSFDLSPQLIPAMVRALEDPESTAPALELLSIQHHAACVPVLLRLLCEPSHRRHQPLILRALDEFRDRSAVPALLELIRQPDLPTASLEAAFGALGGLGDVGVVQHLLPFAGRLGGGAGAARRAITRIQSRLEGAEPGRLSLAEVPGAAGGLSLSEGGDAAGGLSVTEGPGRKRGRRVTKADKPE